MKKVLVLGATGNLGSSFIEYLNESDFCKNVDFEIIAAGRKDGEKFSGGVKYYQVDITNKSSVYRLPEDVYAVVDFAGIMPARMRGYEPQKYIETNILGTLNVLEYCRETGVDRILFMQSFGDIKEYGETKIMLRTDMPRRFSFKTDHTVYVLSKNFAVDLIENYHQMYGLKRYIFRLPTVYQYFHEDTYYVDGVRHTIGFCSLIRKAIDGKDIEVWGDPSRVKDMVYVKDMSQMISRALVTNSNVGYYNVGTGVGTSLIDQIKGIVQVFGNKDINLILRPDKPNAPQYIMDISLAQRELGYKPKYNYIDMLKEIKNKMENENK